MISGSALDRVHACPVSESLPHAEELHGGQDRGNAVHDFLARVPEMGREEALELVPDEWHDACAGIDLDQLPASSAMSYSAEVAFAYDIDTDTARVLGTGIGRRYDVGPNEVPGSVDSVGIAGDQAQIIDYKSPWADLPPASRNRQIRFYALAACRAYGCTSAVVMLIRVREDGSAWIDKDVLDSMDLHEVAAEVRDAVQRARAAKDASPEDRPVPVIGSHCRWCPAARFCPAHRSLVSALAHRPEDLEEETREWLLSPETAPIVLERLAVARRALERIEWTVKDYASRNPVELPEGEVYGPHRVTKETLDGDVVRRVIESDPAYGGDAARRALKVTATKTAIEQLARDRAEETGGKIAPEKRRLLAAIDEAGGIARRTMTKVERYRPKDTNPRRAS